MFPTKEKLAQRLHSLGLFELEKEARAGEFSDFENKKYAAPKGALVALLMDVPLTAAEEWMRPLIQTLIDEVKNGEWDDTKEEGQAWFAREGKDLLK